MQRTVIVALFLIGLGAAGFVGERYFTQDGKKVAQVWANPNDAALVARGAEVYRAQCATCHGVRLEGQANWRQRRPDGRLPAPPHDASGHTWHHADQQLFDVIKQGTAAFAPAGYKTDMGAYKDILADRDIWAVLAYIKTQWPQRIRERQAGLTARSKAQTR